jgi:hypothetical protein
MLASHLNALEKVMIAQSAVAINAGHPNLRGSPREWFIRDFLESHLPSSLEIGQGEIIDFRSSPKLPRSNYRPQADIVIYRRDVPKIALSKNDTAFLVEGVMATIESKSVLTKHELKSACKSSKTHKALTRQFSAGFRSSTFPSHIVSYVVAYDSKTSIKTVAKWLPAIAKEEGINPDRLVEMVIVLGKGVVWKIGAFPGLEIQGLPPRHQWAFIEQTSNNLFSMFVHMLTWTMAISSPPNILGYVESIFSGDVKTL